MLKKTSRTFFIPISRLDGELKEAVTSAYLCMRAIDEIEDHEELSNPFKVKLLLEISKALQSPDKINSIQKLLLPHDKILPDVSLELHKWLTLCPATIAETVYHYIAKMAEQMADWVTREWKIRTVEDLDSYTYSVAGMVGEMLSEIWLWYDGTTSDTAKAIAFGRGLQAVNILRNRKEDLKRGVDFFPDQWDQKDMFQYTRHNLGLADAYIAELPHGPALKFCKIPLALAHATMKIKAAGGNKLTRENVMEIVSRAEE